jgi:hypothetical protein
MSCKYQRGRRCQKRGAVWPALCVRKDAQRAVGDSLAPVLGDPLPNPDAGDKPRFPFPWTLTILLMPLACGSRSIPSGGAGAGDAGSTGSSADSSSGAGPGASGTGAAGAAAGSSSGARGSGESTGTGASGAGATGATAARRAGRVVQALRARGSSPGTGRERWRNSELRRRA